MTVVFAPYINQVGRIEPYVSLNEVKYSATATSLDFENLVENGAQAAQDRSLYELIVRASSKIDGYIYGPYGTLNATSNTEPGRYRVDRYGRFKISPKFKPVIAMSAFEFGSTMGALASLTLSTQNCWMEEDEFIVIPGAGGGYVSFTGPNALSSLTSSTDGEFYVQYTYINGWPNSFLTAPVASGATSFTLLDPTGLYPGMQSQFWDGMNDEYYQVSASYVPGTSTVTTTAPLQYAHGTGTNVSSLPAAVKQACIHFVVAMVKQRGQGGVMLDEMGATTAVSGKIETSAEDEVAGYDLLEPYKAIWGRT